METRDLEKLLTDLKNLPKQNAPEDFEIKLFQRISLFENKKSSGEVLLKRFIGLFYNPIYVPAFTIILVAIVIVFTLNRNQTIIKYEIIEIEKATPVLQETQTQTVQPQKISVPKKKDFVVKRDKIKLNLGPGVSLDESDYSLNPTESEKSSFISFPFPKEPVTIRIPPPEVIFKREFERIGIVNENKDSIKLTNHRRK